MDKKLKIFTIFAFTKAWLISILCLVSLEISHASPIEFWLTGEETFNNKEECSIYPVCFCQTIDPSDTLRLDISDPSDGTNYLLAYLDDGTLWDTFTFTPTGLGDHHQYLSISDWSGVEERRLIFKIANTNIILITAPSTWSKLSGATSDFGSRNATQLIQAGIATSYGAYQAANILSGQTPRPITIHIKTTGLSSGSVSVNLVYWTANGGIPDSAGTLLTLNSNVDSDYTFTFSQATVNCTIFSVFVIGSSPATITITVPVGYVISVPDSSILAQSDCVEITDNQDFICTKLISYSNSTNIAGLGFPSWSPPAIYYLRIPAVFFEEQYPQEQEDLELSDDTIITLWSKMEAKKLLDIGFMPFYMHKKVQLILMMDYISIDGIEYRKRDPYTISEGGSKRHALRRAQVLLSEKDFITRNLL